jgi:hypothetical protein
MEDKGMRAWMKSLAVLVALMGPSGVAQAGGLDRVGTSGALELRIPIGAQAVALGGSSVALGGGLSNLYYNPAALAATDKAEALAIHTTYLADSKVNYGAVSIGVGSSGMMAASVKVLNFGDITVTTEDNPEGTGEILSPNFAVVGLTYGRRMTDRVLLGVTGMFVNERVGDLSARGFAGDIGVQYDTGWHGARFGFAMKNIGPNMQFSGGSLEESIVLPGDDPSAQPHVVQLQSTTFELPAYLQFGATYDLTLGEEKTLTFLGAFQSNNYTTDEYRLGAEFQMGKWLALRGGFVGQLAFKEEDKMNDYLYNYSYGAGLTFKMGDTPFHFDYAGTAVGQFFEDNQQVSLSVAF